MNSFIIQLLLGFFVIVTFVIYHKIKIKRKKEEIQRLKEEIESLKEETFISMDRKD